MRKIKYQELIKSITLFFVNEEIDKKYVKLKEDKKSLLRQQMCHIDSYKGLQQYIKDYEDSLSNILVLLGVSNELFKRVVSMFRIQQGMEFKTEWDTKSVRRYMLDNERMMERVTDLFFKGLCDSELRTQIPGFKLANFVIDGKVMDRLNNDDFLDFLINKDFDTQYNAELSNINVNKIDVLLTNICQDHNYKLVKNENLDPNGNKTLDIFVNYSIYAQGDITPKAYIKYSFNITTAKGQTDFKKSTKEVRHYIKTYNPGAKQIVIVDGAGWIGRQSDLKDVLEYSDYCLTLSTINDLVEILKF